MSDEKKPDGAAPQPARESWWLLSLGREIKHEARAKKHQCVVRRDRRSV